MKDKLKLILRFLGIYKTQSIFVRDFFTVLLIMLIPFLIIGSIMYFNIKSVVEKEIVEINETNLYRCASVIDTMIDELNRMVANISMQNELKVYMIGNRDIYNMGSTHIRLNQYIKQAYLTHKYVDSVYLYRECDDTMFFNGDTYLKNEFYDMNWFEFYEQCNEKNGTCVNLRLKKDKYPYIISIVRPVYEAVTYKKQGAIICNINIEDLCEVVDKKDVVSDKFIVTDESGAIIYSRNKNLIGTQIKSDEFKIAYSMRGVNKEEANVVSVIKPEKYNSWGYGMMMPVSNYADRINIVFFYMWIGIIFCIIFSFMVALIMAVKSFDFASKLMVVIGKGDIKNLNRKDSINEADYILSNIISTIKKNEEMQAKIIEQFNEMRKSQTVALQAQISPHFIRNTLEMINVRAFELMGANNDVSVMISRLSRLLNSFINSGNYIVSLNEELSYTMLYNEIMSMRYDGKIGFFYDIPEEMLHLNVIKLSLQPIVENAVIHSLSQKRFCGNITMKGEVRDEYAEILVFDDASVIDDETLEELKKQLELSGHYEKIGMYNVNKRYKIAFGEDYGLRLEKSHYSGLLVRILFPKYN